MAQMWVGEAWVNAASAYAVRSPYSGETVDEVPAATAADVDLALASAVLGARDMAAMPAWQRADILNKAADLLAQSVEEFADLISRESGKPLSESRGEASRGADLLRLCAFEGSQVRGEVLPLDAQRGASGKMGLTMRVPCGVVVAITPFNFPLLLVLHKIGPALAAGNAAVMKPAQQTPLTALRLTAVLLEAGLPARGIQCLTGSGSELGPVLCADPRVRKISFTGSTSVGEQITRVAGVKKLSLELGSNAPLIVLPDADIPTVARAVAVGGYLNAGQVCISTQRVLVHRSIYADFLSELTPLVSQIRGGDPLLPDTTLGPLISERDAVRVESWINEATDSGARVVTGGTRERALHAATIVADVTPRMRLFQEELFGPAVAVTPVATLDEAIDVANDSRYGLSAAIFTSDLASAWRFVQRIETGIAHVNWTPLWRADLMPYGGLKMSGYGREGPRSAIEEMTEQKSVVFHGVGL